jgi:hypothetical protein
MSTARFPMAAYWVVLALIVLFAIAPIFVTLIAAGIANANGCQLSEGLLTPCVINGVDYGRELQAAGLGVLYILLTIPVAFGLFLAWLTVLLIHRGRHKRRALA